MTFYAGLRATAERLIREKGKEAFLIRHEPPASGGGWDPNLAGPEPDEEPVRMVQTTYKISNRDASAIEAGDVFGIISTESLALPPAKADRIRIGADVYRFVDLQPVNPGGTDIVYRFQARR